MKLIKMGREQERHLKKQVAKAIKDEPLMGLLQKTLLGVGGSHVCFPWPEEDLKELLSDRAKLWNTDRLSMRKGRDCQCHSNSYRLWDDNPNELQIITGYAFNRDGLWRSHSWVWDKVSGRILETTTKRLGYFGFALTTDEAEEFGYNNR